MAPTQEHGEFTFLGSHSRLPTKPGFIGCSARVCSDAVGHIKHLVGAPAAAGVKVQLVLRRLTHGSIATAHPEKSGPDLINPAIRVLRLTSGFASMNTGAQISDNHERNTF